MLVYNVQRSKSILDYFVSQEVRKFVSETDHIISTTAESISESDSEIEQDLIEAEGDKSQEVKKSISETGIISTTAKSIDSISNIELEDNLFEADGNDLLADTEVSLHPSTSRLRDVTSETNHDSVIRVINDSVELTSEQSHSEDCESNPESRDVLQVAISGSRKIKDHEKYELITSSQNNLGNTDLDTMYFTVSGGRKRKQISFQK